MYDALYAWLCHVRDEMHTWNPQCPPAPSGTHALVVESGSVAEHGLLGDLLAAPRSPHAASLRPPAPRLI
jgi:hypothetical protein